MSRPKKIEPAKAENHLSLSQGTCVDVEVKAWYQSSTIIFNVLSALILILSLLTPLDVVGVYVKDPEKVKVVTTTISLLIAVINILLRFFKTNEPLTLKK